METCPHYLTHTTEFSSVKGKVVPPLRSKLDLQSMWYGLRNGIIDTVGTDHVANTLSLKLGKRDLWTALSGFPGMGTMLPVLLSEGVNKDRITLERLVEITSYNTARAFDMYPSKGTIMNGSDADLTVIDLEMQKTVTPDLLLSSSDYTIYDGWKLTGWPVTTIVRGMIVVNDGLVDEKTLGHGKLIPRTYLVGAKARNMHLDIASMNLKNGMRVMARSTSLISISFSKLNSIFVRSATHHVKFYEGLGAITHSTNKS